MSFEFAGDEAKLAEDLSVPHGWDDVRAKELKKKLKKYLLKSGIDFCCYCRVPMRNWHKLSIDLEHVLPKGKFPIFTFSVKNINVACKRCNMGIKLEDHTFYIGTAQQMEAFESEHYNFIHPNLDRYEDHLRRKSEQDGIATYVKFAVVNNSAKGWETYRYFHLNEIEHNTFDEGQGSEPVTVSPDIAPKLAAEITESARLLDEM
jgi:hypothetical protein